MNSSTHVGFKKFLCCLMAGIIRFKLNKLRSLSPPSFIKMTCCSRKLNYTFFHFGVGMKNCRIILHCSWPCCVRSFSSYATLTIRKHSIPLKLTTFHSNEAGIICLTFLYIISNQKAYLATMICRGSNYHR